MTVNAVTPGVVDTDIRAGATNPELAAKLEETGYDAYIAAARANA